MWSTGETDGWIDCADDWMADNVTDRLAGKLMTWIAIRLAWLAECVHL